MNKDNIRENEYKAHSFDEYIRLRVILRKREG